MASTTKTRPMGDVPDAMMGLLQAQMKWGQQMYEEFTGSKAPDLTQMWNDWLQALAQPAKAAPPGCTVAPPCWMPRKLADVSSYASHCGTVRVRITVTNCDRMARTVKLRLDGADAISFSPESITLNPMRRASFEVSCKVPESAKSGDEIETLIWIEGSHDHVMRWTVLVGSSGADSTYEFAIDDCPDYRHHWYDHFYCVRTGQSTRVANNG